MPKSKKRKMRYTPKSRPAQPQPLAAAAQPTTRTSEPAQTTAPQTMKTKGTTGKTQSIPQSTSVGTELKVISIVTVILVAAIVVLYFIFR